MILFGLHGGLGNSLFCLPAIKALSRLDEVRLCVEGDYDMLALWKRCRYATEAYGQKDVLPSADRYVVGQYTPSAFRGKPVEFCGWPRGTQHYPHPEWMQIKRKACGNGEKEDVSDWIDVAGDEKRGFALVPCGKPGPEWERKKWRGFQALALRLEAAGHSVEAFGQPEEVKDAGIFGWYRGHRNLEALPEAISHARVAVANDCGLGHLASSIGIPTVMLFTATSYVKGQPLGRHAIVGGGCSSAPVGCQSTPTWRLCLDHECREIAVKKVQEAALELFGENNQKSLDLLI